MNAAEHPVEDVPRVAHLMVSPALGGLEQCAALWCEYRNRRHPGSTCLVCLEPAAAGQAVISNAPHTCLYADRTRFPWDRHVVGRLQRFMGETRIDVMHSHNTAARQYAALAVRQRAVAHVYTDHGSNRYLTGPVNHLRLHFMRRHTDACIAVSGEAATRLALAVGDPPGTVPIIRNGITAAAPVTDCTILRAAVRAEWHVPAAGVILGWVGRLAPEKGVDRLIRTVARMPSPCMLVLIGEGSQRPDLETLCRTLKLTSRVRFAGAQPQARHLMRAFDLFVLPSRSEGLPLALLEAMAEGVPAAATDTGECRAVLDNGRAGILLPPNENDWPATLGRVLEPTHANDTWRRTACAARRIREHYSLEQTLTAYEAVYQTVLRQP